MKPRTALLSVYHKEGIVEFAQDLVQRGWSILSSGGTAKALVFAGVPVRDISEIVGKAILGHRVVTLSREIHAGLLARDIIEDVAELEALGAPWIDVVCVDLYPLHEEIAKPGSTRASVIEKTDVGGPTMLHSASKGERFPICRPEDRSKFIAWLDDGCHDEQAYKDRLAGIAQMIVAEYILTAGRYRNPDVDGFVGFMARMCKYGENAWQTLAALFQTNTNDPLAIHNFQLVGGTDPSYNNYCDIDRALQTLTHMRAVFQDGRHLAVAVKHGNPCGAAFARHSEHRVDVTEKVIFGDPRAIFGGLVMTTFPINNAVAEKLLFYPLPQGKRVLDTVVAPSFTDEAVDLLSRKEGKCRLLVNPTLGSLKPEHLDRHPRFRYVRGGFLRQPNYTYVLNWADVTPEVNPASPLADDMLLAWAVGSTSNSNTIALVNEGRLIGNGVGQQDRVGCCKLAVERARDAGSGHDTRGAVAYSDSFFPFTDGPQVLINAGVSAILASSGSVRDAVVRKLCLDHDVPFFTIPDAVGRGFFGH